MGKKQKKLRLLLEVSAQVVTGSEAKVFVILLLSPVHTDLCCCVVISRYKLMKLFLERI